MEKTIYLIEDKHTGQKLIHICGDDIYGYYTPEEAYAVLNRLMNELIEAYNELLLCYK